MVITVENNESPSAGCPTALGTKVRLGSSRASAPQDDDPGFEMACQGWRHSAQPQPKNALVPGAFYVEKEARSRIRRSPETSTSSSELRSRHGAFLLALLPPQRQPRRGAKPGPDEIPAFRSPGTRLALYLSSTENPSPAARTEFEVRGAIPATWPHKPIHPPPPPPEATETTASCQFSRGSPCIETSSADPLAYSP